MRTARCKRRTKLNQVNIIVKRGITFVDAPFYFYIFRLTGAAITQILQRMLHSIAGHRKAHLRILLV